MKISTNCGFFLENLELVKMEFYHEFGHKIRNKLHIWVRDAVGNIYIQRFIEHVGPRFTFFDFLSGVGNWF